LFRSNLLNAKEVRKVAGIWGCVKLAPSEGIRGGRRMTGAAGGRGMMCNIW